MVVGDQDRVDAGQLAQAEDGRLEAPVQEAYRGSGLREDGVDEDSLPLESQEDGRVAEPDEARRPAGSGEGLEVGPGSRGSWARSIAPAPPPAQPAQPPGRRVPANASAKSGGSGSDRRRSGTAKIPRASVAQRAEDAGARGSRVGVGGCRDERLEIGGAGATGLNTASLHRARVGRRVPPSLGGPTKRSFVAAKRRSRFAKALPWAVVKRSAPASFG